MNFNKLIVKASALMPTVVVLGITIFLIIPFSKLGHIPQYCIDKDPNAVLSDNLYLIKNLFLISSFYLLVISIILLIVMFFLRGKEMSNKDKLFTSGIYLLGLILLVLNRESNSFTWLVD